MVRPRLPWLTSLLVCSAVVAAQPRLACAAAAEVKLDRDYLAGLIDKLPAMPFETPGKAKGTVHEYHLVAIDPQTRRFVVACVVDGEYRPPLAGPLARRDGDGSWRKFRFEVRVGINVEPGNDGTPKFHIAVEEVRRKELEGLAGTLAKLLGKYFDDMVTRVAAGKANQLSGKLNAEIVKRVAAFREYGVFTGIDYTQALVVLHFEMTRFKPEGIAGYVYPPAAAEAAHSGTVPLFRAVHPRLGAHLYTVNRADAARLGFRIEGIACQVFDRPVPETVPLYRWRVSRDGFYTTARDGEGCYRLGYRPEGIACFLYPDARPGTIPFYRFVDPRTGHHFYTVHPNAEFARSGLPVRGLDRFVGDHDVDAHRDRVPSSPQDHTLDRAHVVIVAAPSQCDMSLLTDQIIGGVDVDPARARTEYRQPRVRHVGANESLLALGWGRQEIAADVAGGEPQCAETADLEVREVLADAGLALQELKQRRVEGTGARDKAKLGENAPGQIEDGFEQGPARRKRVRGIRR